MNLNLTALLASGALAAAANATIIEARLDSVSPERHMQVSVNGGDSFRTLYTGVNNFTVTGGDTNLLGPSFVGFCIDLGQTIHFNQSNLFTVTQLEDAPLPGSGMGATKADLLRELWGRHFSPSFTSTQAAAFQSAVWEIVFDTGLNVHTGTIRIDGHDNTENLANDWLASLTGTSSLYAPVFALTSGETQDMIVPTPGSVALLALGGLVVGRRRR